MQNQLPITGKNPNEKNAPELIKVTENERGEKTVSARLLYEFLEVKTEFSNWCKRMFEYDFEENVDFSLVKIGERSAHNKIDYALTLDTAKEISMLQRTEKGKEARHYFIEMEKVAKIAGISKNPFSVMSRKQMLQMALESEEIKEALQLENKIIKTINEEQKLQLEIAAPKLDYLDNVLLSNSTFITSIIAGELGISAIKLNKFLKEQHVQRCSNGTWYLLSAYQNMGYTKNHDFVYNLKDNGSNTAISMKWTEKGRLFIHELWNNKTKGRN